MSQQGDAKKEDQTPEGGSFLGQFGATVIKNFNQKRREPFSCCLEMFLPVLFVIGTILIWLAFPNDTFRTTQYIDYNVFGPRFKLQALYVQSNLCYDDATPPIGGLANCGSKTYPTRCGGRAQGLLRDGFCYNSNRSVFDPRIVIFTFMSQGRTNVSLIPTMSTVAQLQWLAKASRIFSNGRFNSFNTPLASISSTGYLYFAPKSADTANLVNYLNATEPMFNDFYGGTFDTSRDAENRVTDVVNTEGRNWGIIDVGGFTPSAMNVRIRLNLSAIGPTAKVLDGFYEGGTGKGMNNQYIVSGFASIQRRINDYYITNVLGKPAPPQAIVSPMGFQGYTDKSFLTNAGQLVPLVVVLGFMYPVSQLTKRIVMEKELRIREAMMIMGLGTTSFYLSWFVTYILQNIFPTLVMTILLRLSYLKGADFGIVFFLFFLFGISNIALAGIMAACFSKARIAAMLAPLIFFALSMPLFATDNVDTAGKRGLLLLSPTCFTMGIQLLFDHELSGGLGAKAIADFRDDPNMVAVLFLLGIDAIIYTLIMIYIDAIMPNDWGIPKHPLFFIIDPIRYFTRSSEGENTNDGRDPDGVFEDEDASADGNPVTVRVQGLVKTFQRGADEFVAVNNLHWSLRENQVAVLLGHNGAGKSTTINLMTGMLTIDKGDCIIYGKSVKNQLHLVRQEIGFCPQHNVLWPELTCAQHLRFYASIKGISGDALEESVDQMLKEVDLLEKKENLADELSGGQKRKLSVAIAFIGKSRLIFLDEPTAGMDVGARRHTWDLIKRMSVGRTILLTTHYMDEADLLGHQIAIMSTGSLKCCGSSLFLKSRLGVGYNITLSILPHADTRKIGTAVASHVAECELLTSGAGEMSYRLPTAALDRFPPLLKLLEDDGPSLGVQGFSVNATTLEEIFLKIAVSGETNKLVTASGAASPRSQQTPGAAIEMDTRDPDATSRPNLSGGVWNIRRETENSVIFASQLRCMLTKRFNNAKRDRRTQCLQIISPVVIIILAMLLTLINFIPRSSLNVNSNLYGTQTEVVLQGCNGVLFNPSYPLQNGVVTTSPAGLSNALDLSNYLLNTSKSHSIERYGAISCTDTTLSTALGASTSTLFYNYSANHEVPISINNYAMYYARNVAANDKVQFNVDIEPMPATARESAVANSFKSITIGIIIMIPFTFIPSVFVSWIVKEKETKARHLQNVSGLRFSCYWLSNFLFDIFSFFITEILVLIVFAVFNRVEYIGTASNFFATFVLILFYGLSGIGMSYVLSFMFHEHSSAQNTVMLGNFICGFLLVLVVFILKLVESTTAIGKALQWIFRIVPAYCLGDGIIAMSLNQLTTSLGAGASPWSMDVIGADLIYMAVEFPLFILITYLWDHPERKQRMQRALFNPQLPQEAIDGAQKEEADVAAEREEIKNYETNHRKTDLVIVNDLRKVYDNGKVAVNNLSFGIHAGEVFGFLGTNGAGKTTTISILCQEFLPSNGCVRIAGHDIVYESEEALKYIGYCPQFDALLDNLTVDEHLWMYAGVRGIVFDDRAQVVESLMHLCDLVRYRETIAVELSGGNRRKLSVALSLIGGPQVVFLDEPSAGMDPVARRGLWTAVQTVADNCAVVLTTHHLEEVEALAHRVAIMVDGTLRCIGDKTHLKTKYGTGFELTLRVGAQDNYDALVAFMKSSLPSSHLDEYRSLKFTYALPSELKLSAVFALVQAHKAELGITDYSIAQTSIEQVFLRISEAAIEGQATEDETAAAQKLKDKKQSPDAAGTR